jgi:hypothetical protein
MQTLKDVLKRENERVHLKNGAICISIVIIVVLLAFGLKGMHFAFQQSPPKTPTSVITDGENNN